MGSLSLDTALPVALLSDLNLSPPQPWVQANRGKSSYPSRMQILKDLGQVTSPVRKPQTSLCSAQGLARSLPVVLPLTEQSGSSGLGGRSHPARTPEAAEGQSKDPGQSREAGPFCSDLAILYHRTMCICGWKSHGTGAQGENHLHTLMRGPSMLSCPPRLPGQPVGLAYSAIAVSQCFPRPGRAQKMTL